MAFGEPDGSFSRTHGGQVPTMTKVDATIGKLPHSAIPEDQPEYVKYKLPSRKTWSFGPILEDMIRAADDPAGDLGDAEEEFEDVTADFDDRRKAIDDIMAKVAFLLCTSGSSNISALSFSWITSLKP